MNLFDLLKEDNSKKRYYTEKSDAEKYFIEQKIAIDWIKNTKWFKEIRDYRQRIVVACNERLRTIKTEEIKRVQGELDIAMWFLNFLDSILAEELTKEDLDILNS